MKPSDLTAAFIGRRFRIVLPHGQALEGPLEEFRHYKAESIRSFGSTADLRVLLATDATIGDWPLRELTDETKVFPIDSP